MKKERKKIEVQIQTWSKLKELIKSKDLIKLLICLIDLFNYLIKEKLSLKIIWAKIKRIN